MSNQFINPYTFIPITDKVERRKLETGDLSGVIKCKLTIKSPTFIPNTNRDFKDKQTPELKVQEFFSYDTMEGISTEGDQLVDVGGMPKPECPRIPGSEIRGMIRNVYEQVTNSCFAIISRTFPHKRTAQPKKIALWDRETDTLFACKKAMLNTRATMEERMGYYVGLEEYRTGEKVYITLGNNYQSKKRQLDHKVVKRITSKSFGHGELEGYVLIGEKFANRKHHDTVAYAKSHKITDLTETDKKRLEKLLKQYLEDDGFKDVPLEYDSGPYKDFRKAYTGFKKGEDKYRYLPVYYSQVGEVYYLSPACITKEVFSRTYEELLEEDVNGNHQPCDGAHGNWCPACSLFGMVDQSGNESAESIKGRLRFCDSEIIKNPSFDNFRTLPILGTPKTSATEFYLEKPSNESFWNYDYYLDKVNDAKLYTPELRGRKVYWLKHPDYLKSNLKSLNGVGKNFEMRVKVRPLLAGTCEFAIYYQDLTKEELSLLLWCLQLEGEALHRIGRGKPLGMGAVKLEVDSVEKLEYGLEDGQIVRKTSEIETASLVPPNDLMSDEQFENRKERILKYLTPLSMKESQLVDYPTAINSASKTYEWFGNNRGSTILSPKIDQSLPHIDNSVEKQLINKNERKKRENNARRRYGR